MKKIGILLAILLIAGVCAMADDAVPATQGAVLFADVDAVTLSQAEMAVVDGGMGIKDFTLTISIQRGVELHVTRDAELARIDNGERRQSRDERQREITERRERRQKIID